MTDRSGILVVDDSPETLKLITELLLGEGYLVRPANSGELALASIRAEPPELVLLDIRIPGVDGFEVCRQMKARAESRDIPVIFISVATELEESVEGFALGAVDFVSTPFQREELLARVRTHLELSRLRGQLEVIVNDRTAELLVANAALRESEERFRSLYENSRDAVFLTSPDGPIFSANPAASRLFGHTEEEFRGLGRAAIVDETDPRLSAALAERARTGRLQTEIRFKRKDGMLIECEVASVVFHDTNGNTRTATFLRDITERKQAVEALREAHEALENWVDERERLAMDLHDGVIQSLYAVMLGMSTQDRLLADREVDLRAGLRHARNQISQAIGELRHYVSDLRPHHIAVGGLRAGLEAVVADFRMSTPTPPVLQLEGDVDCMLGADAMYSLLYIVREATSNTLRHAGSCRVKITLERPADRIMLSIRDDGKGFDTTALPGKPGQGLRNMAERAAMLGGLLTIESKTDQGTEVRLALPADGETAALRYLSRGAA